MNLNILNNFKPKIFLVNFHNDTPKEIENKNTIFK